MDSGVVDIGGVAGRDEWSFGSKSVEWRTSACRSPTQLVVGHGRVVCVATGSFWPEDLVEEMEQMEKG